MNNVPLASIQSASLGLAPDPALPQRDLLLDDRQMAAHLSSLITRGGPSVIDSCEKQRIKYRIGESLRVLYRLGLNGNAHLIAAKAFARPLSESAGSSEISQHKSARFDSEIGAAFSVFPEDRKIRHLILLREQPGTLSVVLGSKWHRSEGMAYVPEKCATVRCLDRDGQTIAYAKMYAAAQGHSVAETYLQLASSCPRVVKPIEYSELHQLLLLHAIPGSRIADLQDKQLSDGFAGLAQTLASLHSTSIPSHLPHFLRHDPDRLRNCARIIGIARPDVARVATELDRELRSTIPSEEPLVCLHGDVHPKNGIAANGCVTLIDLDQSAVGPAAADLGSMLALLHYNRRIGLLTHEREQELANVFLDAYAGSRQLPTQKSLRWHTAAALLSERALRSVNRVRPEGLHHLSQLLNDAREILRTEGVNS
ncbi:MAG TPA: aminoglycoside phosphotransferase family protein [Pyrinomonadaceae bacterium]|nr:aminoglycoside phosphotransferase family protein [Pyrinomonadaceae bacterium]